jgi:hypothetical protein
MAMLRKTIIAFCTVASVGMLAPEVASAANHSGGSRGGSVGASGPRTASVNQGTSGWGNSGGWGNNRGAFASNNFRGEGRGEGFRGEGRGDRFREGFRDGNFGFGGFAFGLGYPYDYGYYDYPYGDYAYNDSYYDDGGCYLVPRRVHTPYGWRIRRVQVCG